MVSSRKLHVYPVRSTVSRQPLREELIWEWVPDLNVTASTEQACWFSSYFARGLFTPDIEPRARSPQSEHRLSTLCGREALNGNTPHCHLS